jgi:hypothetical protein
MDDDLRHFDEELGRKALRQDWAGVHALLAPWLQHAVTVDQVRAFFEDEYRRTLEDNGAKDLQFPAYPDPEVGGNNFLNATKLREPISWDNDRVRPVPAVVTDGNMRYWMNLRLLASDEQMATLGFDTFSDTWIAVVATDQGLRVGYWSQGAY